jgi:hypothetical protein
MKTYYITVSHPPYPWKKGRKISATFRKPERDHLPSTLIGVWTVDAVSREDAIANAVLGKTRGRIF